MKQFPQLQSALLYILVIILVSCTTAKEIEPPAENTAEEDEEKITAVHDAVEETFSRMDLKAKIGQLFIIDIRTPVTGDPIQKVNEYAEELLLRYQPGGVILFGGNIRNPYQVRSFIADLQNLSAVPLFIATDEEGGAISRLNYSPEMPIAKMPSAFRIGNTADPSNAEAAGHIIGIQLKSLGINMNNAPVADILTNPANPVIGPRSFGTEPELVGTMVSGFIRGLQREGVIAVMKHFPGHGDTTADSHSGKVSVDHTLNRIENVEMVPFMRGIEAGGQVIMTAHINVSSLEDIPATFSSFLIKDFLRERMGYKGLVVSDSLGMGAISHYYSPDRAPVLALKAGVDIILIPDDIEKAYEGVEAAVHSGEISVEEIDNKVRKILALKNEFNILSGISLPDPHSPYPSSESRDFYRYIMGIGR